MLHTKRKSLHLKISDGFYIRIYNIHKPYVVCSVKEDMLRLLSHRYAMLADGWSFDSSTSPILKVNITIPKEILRAVRGTRTLSTLNRVVYKHKQ